MLANARTGKIFGWDPEYDGPSRVQIEIPPFKASGILLGTGQTYREAGKSFVRYVIIPQS